jgi:hypothetical protein
MNGPSVEGLSPTTGNPTDYPVCDLCGDEVLPDDMTPEGCVYCLPVDREMERLLAYALGFAQEARDQTPREMEGWPWVRRARAVIEAIKAKGGAR